MDLLGRKYFLCCCFQLCAIFLVVEVEIFMAILSVFANSGFFSSCSHCSLLLIGMDAGNLCF